MTSNHISKRSSHAIICRQTEADSSSVCAHANLLGRTLAIRWPQPVPFWHDSGKNVVECVSSDLWTVNEYLTQSHMKSSIALVIPAHNIDFETAFLREYKRVLISGHALRRGCALQGFAANIAGITHLNHLDVSDKNSSGTKAHLLNTPVHPNQPDQTHWQLTSITL